MSRYTDPASADQLGVSPSGYRRNPKIFYPCETAEETRRITRNRGGLPSWIERASKPVMLSPISTHRGVHSHTRVVWQKD